MLTAFSSLVLATPALAATRDHHATAIAPCDADTPFDGVFDTVAFRPDNGYFPDDEEAAPDSDEQAVPDEGDEGGDDPAAEGDDEAAPDGEGCAEIMVAPYDLFIRPPEQSPAPAALRRRSHAVQRPSLI
ncbi:MAG: hypothetical protein V4574_12865 [Pseudomonadota bacterium]